MNAYSTVTLLGGLGLFLLGIHHPTDGLKGLAADSFGSPAKAASQPSADSILLLPKRCVAVAREAAWRAILEVAHRAVDAIRRRLAGESAKYDPSGEEVQQIEHFLESLSIETTDLSTIGPRLVRLVHALDHLSQLNDDLKRIPPVATNEALAGFKAGAQALSGWLDATKDPNEPPAGRFLRP